ncbi:ribonuclease J [Cohnella sp.]|uniref:ribonuclease J n=1 Tax=Cohnella sp. TaxID=1883426 RepID=UPI003565E135
MLIKKSTRRRSIPAVKIFALGGLGEIGKNMYGIQYKDEIILIDCGLKFPDAQLPGVDYIIPDFRYLLEHKDKVKGLFLTHGHEDHIGGIPYLLKQLQIPVYGAPLTIGLLRAKLEEHQLLSEAKLNIFNEEDCVVFQYLSVEFFRTSHSIPDAFGMAVKTPYGYVVQTGDFKFDFTPVGPSPNIHKMAAIGERGVLALLSDSTNSERTGTTPSEKLIGESIFDIFQSCKGRILFATFASNVHRLQQVVEAAIATGRKLVVIGRSMEKVFIIGQELGYIRVPEGMIIEPKDTNRFQEHQLVIICTGSQGESQAALTRIASGSHRWVQVYPEDTVIFSSSPIPGNVVSVNRSIDLLMRAGAHVVYGSVLDIHTSGHGSQEDLKLMLRLMRPRYFVPIHGEFRMLTKHADLAEKTGVQKPNIFVLEMGDVLYLKPQQGQIGGKIPSGETLVNGKFVMNMDQEILLNRLQMGNNGVVIAVLMVSKDTQELLTGPTLISRGFVYVRESGAFLAQTEASLKKVLSSKILNLKRQAWSNVIEETLDGIFKEKLGRSPYILPVIMEH